MEIEPGEWVTWNDKYRPTRPLWTGWAMVESIYKASDGQWVCELSKYNDDTGELTSHTVLARALIS